MYGLLTEKRHIERILSGEVDELWETWSTDKRGKIAFIDIFTGILMGFGELTEVSEIPYSQYLQYYGTKRYRWESVPVQDGSQKAYRFVFRNSYRITNPGPVRLIGRDNFLARMLDSDVAGFKRQASLFDKW